MSASEFEHDRAEIKALLWPFYKKSMPQRLQEIGFELNLPQGMIHLFIPSSFFEEDFSGNPKKVKDVIPYGAAEQMNDSIGARKDSNGKQKIVLDLVTYVAAGQMNDYVGARKRPVRKRIEDDDSWMPEGWVKKVNPRPFGGKFPGYGDKTYYAPGIKRAFRSKAAALEWIKSTGGTSNQQQNGGPQTIGNLDGIQIAEVLSLPMGETDGSIDGGVS